MKVLFMTNIPSPYRVEFFNELGKYCDLTVLFERDNDKYRRKEWLNFNIRSFKSIFLNCKRIGHNNVLCKDVLKYLNKKKYDLIVVGGYATPTAMLAILHMKMKRIPFILNADGGFIRASESRLTKIAKKLFIRSATWWLSSGKHTTEYLIYYGAKRERIFTYPFTSVRSNEVLDRPLSQEEKENLRNELNISEDKVILSVGRFIPSKGFDVLLKSAAYLPRNYGIYIVGGKPPQEYIELRKQLRLEENVHFVDFKLKPELRKYYMASDLFVLPTRSDVWGLVINEAMANGLPVITTNRCIAGLELVTDYENGFIVPVDDDLSLSQKINLILENEALKRNMSIRNLEKIRGYTIEMMAEKHAEIFKIIKRENN